MGLTPISHLHDEVIELYEQHGSYLAAASELHRRHPELAKPNQLRSYIKQEVVADAPDYEVLSENVRLAKQAQKQTDLNRVKNKAFREHARIENAVTDYSEAILEQLKLNAKGLGAQTVRTGPLNPDAATLIVHLSDHHMNELVELPTCRYDFTYAAKRLQLLARKTKSLGKMYGVEKVVVFFGGDLMNSDRRLDEMLAAATNRAKATVLAVHLYRQFLDDLRSEFFIDCFGITGNESRAKQELGWVDVVATDSYDFSIYAMLNYHYSQCLEPDAGMRFHQFDTHDAVFQIGNQTFLGIHGHQANAYDQKKIQSLIGMYATKGIIINHILCGHIHATCISDYVSRNSSLVGSNSYSENALGLVSKAAQNIHIVTDQGLDGFKADLQNVDGVEGYQIIPMLEAYNAKSAAKASDAVRDPKTIVKVVV